MELEEEFTDAGGEPQLVAVTMQGSGLILTPTEKTLFEPGKVEVLRKEIGRSVTRLKAEIYVLNMEKVSFISSSFLGMLVSLVKKLRARDIPLRLCNLAPELKHSLQSTKLDRLLDIRSDLNDALSAV
jgi:anti-anti-sigma factor